MADKDPWGDVRKGLVLTNDLVRYDGDYSDPDTLLVAARGLLADADALLMVRDVVRDIEQREENFKGHESALDYDAVIEAICEELRNALAALPERVK